MDREAIKRDLSLIDTLEDLPTRLVEGLPNGLDGALMILNNSRISEEIKEAIQPISEKYVKMLEEEIKRKAGDNGRT